MAKLVCEKVGYGWVCNGKEISNHAAAAKLIREDLKEAFPGTKFRVKARGYNTHDAIDVDWTDGPSTALVAPLLRKYQEGDFDGMIDLYEYTNLREDVPQVNYVHTQRESSNAARQAVVDQINAAFGWDLKTEVGYGGFLWVTSESDEFIGNGIGHKSGYIHQWFYATSFVCPDCKAVAEVSDLYCAECGKGLREGAIHG